MTVTKTFTSNFIGPFLQQKREEALEVEGLRKNEKTRQTFYSDIALLLDVSPDAVNNWHTNKTGAKTKYIERLAFAFSEMPDTLTLPAPYHKTNGDGFLRSAHKKRLFVNHILKITDGKFGLNGPRVTLPTLAIEWRRSAEFWLEANARRKPQEPATAPVGDRMPMLEQFKDAPEGPLASCDARPQTLSEVPRVVVEDVFDTERNQIKMFLQQAEIFRRNNNLEWVLEEGKLRARRVVTEEF